MTTAQAVPAQNVPLRASRQAGLLPPDRLAQMAIVVIGVGAIGRQVALGLGAAGVGTLILFDHDTVGEENLANQGFRLQDIKLPKVDAVQRNVLENNSGVNVVSHNRRYDHERSLAENCGLRLTPEMIANMAVFLCVDSIETRGHIMAKLPFELGLIVDARMSADTLRVLSVWDTPSRQHYMTTLFAESEAVQENCTTRSSWYTAGIAAGLMVSQLSKYLRNMTVALEKDVQMNLLSTEIIRHQ